MKSTINKRLLGVSIVSVMGLAGCATPTGPTADEPAPAAAEELVSSAVFDPLPQPQWQVGVTAYQVNPDDGTESSWTIVQVDNGQVTARQKNGCEWSVPVDWFTPNNSWSECGENPDWASGVRVVEESSGSLWPLNVGNKATYRGTHKSLVTGETFSDSRTCEVPAIVTVSTAIGPIDAFKIVCQDTWGSGSYTVRTWYWSPEHGEVKHMRWHSKRGLEAHKDTVRFEQTT